MTIAQQDDPRTGDFSVIQRAHGLARRDLAGRPQPPALNAAMRRCHGSRCWFWPLLLLAASATASSQEPKSEEPGDVLGWHVVQPGESLAKITEQYLGYQTFWPDNWALNPSIRNPSLLKAGQRVRVIIRRILPPRTAEVALIKRKVDKQIPPSFWEPARIGNRLGEGSNIRTLPQSSAALVFDDGTNLQVGEDSLVHLRSIGASLTGISRQSVEIIEGQAEVAARPARLNSSEIEIILGDARAQPKTGRSGQLQTRAKLSKEGSAQLMVYTGSSDVAAGGQSVSVPRGMGTVVPKGAPPEPPRKLLPATVLELPSRRPAWNYANPHLSWREVDGAASYTAEICADRSCKGLITRRTGIQQTTWNSDPLPVGSHYVRISAVSANGLDGYPSKAEPFEITSDRVDRTPPVVIAILTGNGTVVSPQEVRLGKGGGLILQAHDDASGVASIRYRWDGGSWIADRGKPLSPSTEGEHLLEFQAVDHLERWSEIQAIRVTLNTAPPSPPEIHDPR